MRQLVLWDIHTYSPTKMEGSGLGVIVLYLITCLQNWICYLPYFDMDFVVKHDFGFWCVNFAN